MPAAVDAELTREPFLPLRFYLSDGRTYVISNPALCWINHGSIYIARTDRPNSRIMDVDLVPLRHIVRVEQVNGAGRGGTATGPEK